MAVDMKEWIQNRAEELVFNLFVEPSEGLMRCCPRCGHQLYDEFDEQWERHKDWAYKVAMSNYVDHYSSLIDYAYEREKERQLLG